MASVVLIVFGEVALRVMTDKSVECKISGKLDVIAVMRTMQLAFGILALSLALLNQAGGQTFLSDGLVGWYPFNDGNANDQSVSSDLNGWTNVGTPFTATNRMMAYPRYWDVDNWSQLSFRLQIAQ